jgi:hypothetical protein
MRVFLIFVLVLCLNQFTAFGQAQLEWVLKDDTLINQVKKVVLGNPATIETYFKRNGYQRSLDSLGFNWVKSELTVAGGYITFYADFYYLNESLRTLILWAYLPDEHSIRERYYKSFATFLPIDSGDAFYYKFNPENILKPLPEYLSPNGRNTLPLKILNYMSPTSGLYYGYRGGVAGSVLENRQAFEAIKDDLTNEQIVMIMYSINPASRLTAIEFYLKNKTRFKDSDKIQTWIKNVYSQCPNIQTFNGCIINRESSSSLVQKFVKSSFR